MQALTLTLERPIAFYPQLARALGGTDEAVFVQQLYYWRDKGTRADGYIYKTKEEIEKETSLSRKTQDRIRNKLEGLGVLRTKLLKANGAPTVHYYLILTELQALLNGLAPTGLMEKPQRDYSITKTTTKTTSITNVIEASPENQSIVLDIPDDGVDDGFGVEILPPVPPAPPSDPLLGNELRPIKQRGNPDVNQVIEAFEAEFELKLKRLPQQRFAANRLIKRYGLETTVKGIHAAQLVRDEKYAPQILSIEDLWDKWDKLAAYYRKKQSEQTKITIIEE